MAGCPNVILKLLAADWRILLALVTEREMLDKPLESPVCLNTCVFWVVSFSIGEPFIDHSYERVESFADFAPKKNGALKIVTSCEFSCVSPTSAF